mgnify:CR=1 FL=1
MLDEVAPVRDVYQTYMNLQRELKELTEEVGRKQLQCSALEKEEAEKRKPFTGCKRKLQCSP